MDPLEGKVTLITGAKGGLGSFVTEAFLAGGAKVVGVSRSIQANDFSHPKFTAIAAELSNGEAARRLVEEIVARFEHIDALVHVMGGFAGGTSVAETDDATFEKMLDLNYRVCILHLTRSAAANEAAGRRTNPRSRQPPRGRTGSYDRCIQRFEGRVDFTDSHDRPGEQGPLHFGK